MLVVDLVETLAWLVLVTFSLVEGCLEVTAECREGLVAASSLLVRKSLVLVYLFADLVRHWQHELGTETKVLDQTFSKVLRRVERVVDVPLKLVTQHYVANANVDLDHFE